MLGNGMSVEQYRVQNLAAGAEYRCLACLARDIQRASDLPLTWDEAVARARIIATMAELLPQAA
jgi:hypothetical protein